MKIIVVIPTFYASTQDDDNNIRYNLALETCRAIANANSNNDSDSGNTDFVLQGLIVDASPDETVRQSMFDAGKGHIKVVKQTYQGKKGAALREGIALAAAAAAAAAGGGGGGGGNPEKEAATLLSSSTTTTATVNQEQEENVSINNNNNNNIIVIAFQEPEKVDMIRYWKTLGKKMVQENADLGVPIRTDDSFRSTYPIEQYHSEQFANHYLNALAKRASTTTTSSTTSSSSSSGSVAEIDWTMTHCIHYQHGLSLDTISWRFVGYATRTIGTSTKMVFSQTYYHTSGLPASCTNERRRIRYSRME